MKHDDFDIWNQLDEIKAILSRSGVSSGKSMRLIGTYLNVAEAEFLVRHEKTPASRKQAAMILLNLLDGITELVGALGEELGEDEFLVLLAHTSKIHEWATRRP